MRARTLTAIMAGLILAGLGQPVATAAGPPGALSVLAPGDVDEDGIPDQVELEGIKRPDGSLSMDLAALGASPCRKTVLIEVDYMADADHDHRPDLFGGSTGLPHPDLGVNDTRFEDNGHNQIAVGDFNGDGRGDIAIADASEGGRIHVYDAVTHTAHPDLGVHDTRFEDNGHNQMAVGDFNNDGRDEIAIADHSEGGRIHVYDAVTHTAHPDLGVHDTRFDDDGHNQMAVGDLNGDGRDEIAIADASEGGRVHVYDAVTHAFSPDLGVHDTTFENDDHNQMAVGDLNGDDQDEILIANDSGGRIDVLDATTHLPDPSMGIKDTRFNDDDHNQLAVGNLDGDHLGTAEAMIADASEGGQVQVFDARRPAGPVEEVAAAFASAPVPAATSCPYPGVDTEPGIQLIVEVSGTIPHKPVLIPSEFATIKADPANFDPARDPYVHYNLWVHDYGDAEDEPSGSSGLANFTGDGQDFLVSLGAFSGGNGTNREQAGTFMHELGHSLGLEHGGDEAFVNYKPNYLSVMSYNFQLIGLTSTTGSHRTIVDYSAQALDELDTLHLNEQAGIQPDSPFYTRWYDADRDRRTGAADQPIDWNGNGTPGEADVAVAVNGGLCITAGKNGELDSVTDANDKEDGDKILSGDDHVCNTTRVDDDKLVMSKDKGRFLHGFNDWANLSLVADPAPAPGRGPAELTAAEADTIHQSHDQALAPDRSVRLASPRSGFQETVMGVAMDKHNLYATHYHETIAAPHTSDGPGALIVLDRKTLQRKARVQVGYRPHAVAVNPLTERIYVLNAGEPGNPTVNKVTVLNSKTLSVVATVALNTGQTATDVVVNPRTNRVYVSNNAIGRLHVIDGRTNTELPPIITGPGPLGMAVDENTNTIYIAMSRLAVQPPVTALGAVTDDGVTQTIHPQVPLGPAGTQPWDVAVDPANNRLYTGNLGGGPIQPSVTVLELSSRTIIKQVVTRGPIRAVAVNPYAHQVFAVGDRGVDVVGEQSLSVVRTMQVNLPFAVATGTGQDRHLFVGDVRNGELTRLSYSSGTRK
ncbi:hypothetical protein ACIBH1_48280 [Nonomuraea sp. NPDC050663]|uniref:hypothetical protein n=1 Tax=Nonomuraea sp. NPDC050663 TaxID=3364370 RepID=UPI0037AEB400